MTILSQPKAPQPMDHHTADWIMIGVVVVINIILLVRRGLFSYVGSVMHDAPFRCVAESQAYNLQLVFLNGLPLTAAACIGLSQIQGGRKSYRVAHVIGLVPAGYVMAAYVAFNTFAHAPSC